MTWSFLWKRSSTVYTIWSSDCACWRSPIIWVQLGSIRNRKLRPEHAQVHDRKGNLHHHLWPVVVLFRVGGIRRRQCRWSATVRKRCVSPWLTESFVIFSNSWFVSIGLSRWRVLCKRDNLFHRHNWLYLSKVKQKLSYAAIPSALREPLFTDSHALNSTYDSLLPQKNISHWHLTQLSLF